MPRTLACLIAFVFTTFVFAEPLKLPKTAIADDTFIVVTVNVAKVDPTAVDGAVKGALGDKADDAGPFLEGYKKYHEMALSKGVEALSLVMRGDPNQQKEPEPIVYVRFKAGSDLAGAEKMLRDEVGESNLNDMEISTDGDFLVVRKKGNNPPEAGSEERAAQFAKAMESSDKPIVMGMVFNPTLIESFKKELARGMPPAMMTFITDAASIRYDLTLSPAAKAEVTVDTADEEAAKRVAEAADTLGGLLKQQLAQMKQMAAQGAGLPPDFGAMVENLSAVAEAFKPTQAGTKVSVTLDDKAVAGVVKSWFMAMRVTAQVSPAGKGGL